MRAQHTKVRLTGSGGQCLPVDSLCHSISALVFCRGWTCREVLPKACWSGHISYTGYSVSQLCQCSEVGECDSNETSSWYTCTSLLVFFGCFLVTPVLHCLVRNSSVTCWSWEALLGWSILCLEPQAWELRLWSNGGNVSSENTVVQVGRWTMPSLCGSGIAGCQALSLCYQFSAILVSARLENLLDHWIDDFGRCRTPFKEGRCLHWRWGLCFKP